MPDILLFLKLCDTIIQENAIVQEWRICLKNMKNLHRIFIAINFPEKTRNKLGLFQDRFLDFPAKWVKPQNLHITLNFLGDANDQEVCDICSLVALVAKRHDPFDITLDRICYGPLKKIPPRMIWAVGPKSDELGSLQRDTENTLYEFAGADSDRGKGYDFSPHITLARINQSGIRQMSVEEMPVIEENINYTFMVQSIEVMESEMKRGGPDYTVLESVSLGE